MERRMQPVDVISMCSANGQICPLRVQIPSVDRENIRIHIDQVLNSHQSHHIGTETHIFWCRATLHNRKIEFELQYAIRSHCWFLFIDRELRQ